MSAMSKISILNLKSYRHLKTSLRSYWALGFILLPALLFAVLNLFKSQMAGLLMSLFPPSAGEGIVYYTDLMELTAFEILWIGFFFLLAGALIVYPRPSLLDNVFNIGAKKKRGLVLAFILMLFVFVVLVTAQNTLDRFANSSDEYAYLFQADLLSKGRLWEPAHDLPDFFYVNNLVANDGILLSPFPPGWPLFLSAAQGMGIPPVFVNPVLGLLALVVFYFFARFMYDEKVAIWSVFGVAFTGYYVFNSASFFPHIIIFLTTLLFVSCLYLYGKNRSVGSGLLAGLLLGFNAFIGYFDALLIFLTFLFYILCNYRHQSFYLFLLMAIGAMPFIVLILSYNYLITGDAWLSVSTWAYPEKRLGFVKGHTLVKGFGHILRWVLLFFYWCSPGLLILYVVLLFRKVQSRLARFLNPEDYLFLCLMAGYFFYYQVGGNQYGPRFLFAGFPFLVLFVVSKTMAMREKWPMAVLLASLIYPIVKFPFISYRERRVVEQRQDLFDLVQKEKISNAVVFVSSPTSPIRPMPVDDLTRNDSKFENDVLYALELSHISGKLMQYYADRSFYRYVRNPDKGKGQLVKIR